MRKLILWTYYKRSDGTHAIKIKNGDNDYTPTGFYVTAKQWNKKKQIVNATHPDHVTVNKELKALLISEPTPEVQLAHNFKTFALSFIERFNNLKSKSNFVNYKNTLRILFESDLITNYAFDKINESLAFGFNNYLIVQGYKESTRLKMITHLATIWNDAGVTQKNPFSSVSITPAERIPVSLSQEEVNTIRTIDLDKKLELYRDIFLMSYNNAGVRISDLATLKQNNIVDENNRTYLQYIMRKTGRRVALVQSEEAKRIAQKYVGGKEYLFPLLRPNDDRALDVQIKQATVEVNRGLKKIAAIAGIKKNLHIHSARHTFAKIAGESTGDVLLIQGLLGHSSLKSTQHYLNTLRISDQHLAIVQ